MSAVLLRVYECLGEYILEVSGGINGRASQKSIHNLCKVIAESNAADSSRFKIYIDNYGCGKRFADELGYYFHIESKMFTSEMLSCGKL